MTIDATPAMDAVKRVADAGARAADAGLKKMEQKIEVPAPRRPTWQRWVLPVIGTVLVIVGIVFIWLPFTSLLIVLGLPFMFCFSRRYENAARWRMRRTLVAMRRWLPRRRARAPCVKG